jgi:hypothetical protein
MMLAAGVSLILFFIFALIVLAGLGLFIAGAILMIIAAPKRKIRRGKFTLAIVFLSIGTLILSLCALLFLKLIHSVNQ